LLRRVSGHQLCSSLYHFINEGLPLDLNGSSIMVELHSLVPDQDKNLNFYCHSYFRCIQMFLTTSDVQFANSKSVKLEF
jgi:hypothetical protein